jgi:hypothetical protein
MEILREEGLRHLASASPLVAWERGKSMSEWLIVVGIILSNVTHAGNYHSLHISG